MSLLCLRNVLSKKPVLENAISNGRVFVNAIRHATEAKIPVEPFKLHQLAEGPPLEISVKKEDVLHYYKEMVTIREFENSTKQLYSQRRIHGFCHMYAGEEACGVGIKALLRPEDAVITSYRCHGYAYLLSGGNLTGYFGEVFGKKCGICKGKGGSMHMYTKEPRQLYGGFAIVASQVPCGAGIAFALKYQGKKNVCFTIYGDGAANQGQVFEAFNMAKLFNLPCIFVCENNKYAMGTAHKRASADLTFYDRVRYMPGIWVNGMSVLAVIQGLKFAMDYCDSGKGPIAVELSTYRYTGHSVSDPDVSYRSRDEIQDVRKKSDCIARLRKQILEAQLATEDELNKLKKERQKFVADSAAKALAEKDLPPTELCTDIYVKYEPTIRGATPWKTWPHKDADHILKMK